MGQGLSREAMRSLVQAELNAFYVSPLSPPVPSSSKAYSSSTDYNFSSSIQADPFSSDRNQLEDVVSDSCVALILETSAQQWFEKITQTSGNLSSTNSNSEVSLTPSTTSSTSTSPSFGYSGIDSGENNNWNQSLDSTFGGRWQSIINSPSSFSSLWIPLSDDSSLASNDVVIANDGSPSENILKKSEEFTRTLMTEFPNSGLHVSSFVVQVVPKCDILNIHCGYDKDAPVKLFDIAAEMEIVVPGYSSYPDLPAESISFSNPSRPPQSPNASLSMAANNTQLYSSLHHTLTPSLFSNSNDFSYYFSSSDITVRQYLREMETLDTRRVGVASSSSYGSAVSVLSGSFQLSQSTSFSIRGELPSRYFTTGPDPLIMQRISSSTDRESMDGSRNAINIWKKAAESLYSRLHVAIMNLEAINRLNSMVKSATTSANGTLQQQSMMTPSSESDPTGSNEDAISVFERSSLEKFSSHSTNSTPSSWKRSSQVTFHPSSTPLSSIATAATSTISSAISIEMSDMLELERCGVKELSSFSKPHPNISLPLKVLESPNAFYVLYPYHPFNLETVFRFSYGVLENGGTVNSGFATNSCGDSRKLFVAYQLLRTILFLHDSGLIHGDLRPRNVSVSQRLWLKLGGFQHHNNIQHMLGFEKSSHVTQFSSKRGSINFTQMTAAQIKDHLKDISSKFNSQFQKMLSSTSTSITHGGHLLSLLQEPYNPLEQPSLGNIDLNWTVEWIEGRLSNYLYLLKINELAGRRFGDPNFHPIMPWVIDFTSPTSWRDLTKSKFRLNKGDEQLDFTYSSPMTSTGSKKKSGLGLCSPYAGYLNSGNTAASSAIESWSAMCGFSPYHINESMTELTYYNYFARKTPKSLLKKYVRTNFVSAEYPATMERLYVWTPDECIPEFYTDPSIFKSMHPDMPNLQVPAWAVDHSSTDESVSFDRSVDNFLRMHMEALESEYVSKFLPIWIDLTFGFRLSGEAGKAAKNVALMNTDVHRSSGIVQLFSIPHPNKKRKASLLPQPPSDGSNGFKIGSASGTSASFTSVIAAQAEAAKDKRKSFRLTGSPTLSQGNPNQSPSTGSQGVQGSSNWVGFGTFQFNSPPINTSSASTPSQTGSSSVTPTSISSSSTTNATSTPTVTSTSSSQPISSSIASSQPISGSIIYQSLPRIVITRPALIPNTPNQPQSQLTATSDSGYTASLENSETEASRTYEPSTTKTASDSAATTIVDANTPALTRQSSSGIPRHDASDLLDKDDPSKLRRHSAEVAIPPHELQDSTFAGDEDEDDSESLGIKAIKESPSTLVPTDPADISQNPLAASAPSSMASSMNTEYTTSQDQPVNKESPAALPASGQWESAVKPSHAAGQTTPMKSSPPSKSASTPPPNTPVITTVITNSPSHGSTGPTPKQEKEKLSIRKEFLKFFGSLSDAVSSGSSTSNQPLNPTHQPAAYPISEKKKAGSDDQIKPPPPASVTATSTSNTDSMEYVASSNQTFAQASTDTAVLVASTTTAVPEAGKANSNPPAIQLPNSTPKDPQRVSKTPQSSQTILIDDIVTEEYKGRFAMASTHLEPVYTAPFDDRQIIRYLDNSNPLQSVFGIQNETVHLQHGGASSNVPKVVLLNKFKLFKDCNNKDSATISHEFCIYDLMDYEYACLNQESTDIYTSGKFKKYYTHNSSKLPWPFNLLVLTKSTNTEQSSQLISGSLESMLSFLVEPDSESSNSNDDDQVDENWLKRDGERCSDLFSCGCLIYQILTGNPLFDKHTIRQYIESDGMAWWNAASQTLPRRVKALIFNLVMTGRPHLLKLYHSILFNNIMSHAEALDVPENSEPGLAFFIKQYCTTQYLNTYKKLAFWGGRRGMLQREELLRSQVSAVNKQSNQLRVFPSYFEPVYQFLSKYHCIDSWKQRVGLISSNIVFLVNLPTAGLLTIIPYILICFETEETLLDAIGLVDPLAIKLGRSLTIDIMLDPVCKLFELPHNSQSTPNSMQSETLLQVHLELLGSRFIHTLMTKFGQSIFMKQFLPFLVNGIRSTRKEIAYGAGSACLRLLSQISPPIYIKHVLYPLIAQLNKNNTEVLLQTLIEIGARMGEDIIVKHIIEQLLILLSIHIYNKDDPNSIRTSIGCLKLLSKLAPLAHPSKLVPTLVAISSSPSTSPGGVPGTASGVPTSPGGAQQGNSGVSVSSTVSLSGTASGGPTSANPQSSSDPTSLSAGFQGRCLFAILLLPPTEPSVFDALMSCYGVITSVFGLHLTIKYFRPYVQCFLAFHKSSQDFEIQVKDGQNTSQDSAYSQVMSKFGYLLDIRSGGGNVSMQRTPGSAVRIETYLMGAGQPQRDSVMHTSTTDQEGSEGGNSTIQTNTNTSTNASSIASEDENQESYGAGSELSKQDSNSANSTPPLSPSAHRHRHHSRSNSNSASGPKTTDSQTSKVSSLTDDGHVAEVIPHWLFQLTLPPPATPHGSQASQYLIPNLLQSLYQQHTGQKPLTKAGFGATELSVDLNQSHEFSSAIVRPVSPMSDPTYLTVENPGNSATSTLSVISKELQSAMGVMNSGTMGSFPPCSSSNWPPVTSPSQQWNFSGQAVHSFKEHSSAIKCVSIHENERFILTGAKDGVVKCWDMLSTDFSSTSSSSDRNSTIVGSSSLTTGGNGGATSISSGQGGGIVIGNISSSSNPSQASNQTGSALSGASNTSSGSTSSKVTYNGHKNTVVCVQFVDRGNLVASCDGSIHVWELERGTKVTQLDATSAGSTSSPWSSNWLAPNLSSFLGGSPYASIPASANASFSEYRREFVAGTSLSGVTTTGVAATSAQTPSVVASISPSTSFCCFSSHQDGRVLVCGNTQSVITFADLRSEQDVQCEWQLPNGTTVQPKSICLGHSFDPYCMAVGQSSGHITLIDIRSGLLLNNWRAHDSSLISLQTVPDMPGFILSSSADKTITLWDISRSTSNKMPILVTIFKGHSDPSISFDVYRNSLYSVSGRKIGITPIFDQPSSVFIEKRKLIRSGASITKLSGTTLTTFNILPLQQLALVGSDDGFLKVYH